MSTMLIANNCTRDNGQFMGDQLCYIKIAYLMVQNEPTVNKVLLSMSPSNEMHFLWQKFIDDPRGDGTVPPCEVIYDAFYPGNNDERWGAWDKWRRERSIEGRSFDHYRELYLRIHGAQRQNVLCGTERGLGRRNIYEYVFYGQEHKPDTCVGADWFDDTLIYHPPLVPERDVYISPHCKTQGNITFTFEYWSDVVHRLVSAGVSVTVGYDGPFCEDLNGHPLYTKYWGDHKQWVEQICKHKLVACGNTGTGWVAAACGVPLITMEPHNSVMADHRYRQCGLRNLVEVIDGFTLDSMNNDMPRVAEYCAQRIIAEVSSVIVMTTGCYDVLHAGHVRHLEKSKALGTKLIVALNSDASIRELKGVVDGVQRPINSQEQRKTVLEALRCVDEVRVFDGLDALLLVQELRPQILTCGFGYTLDTIKGRELVESWGGRAVVTCVGDAATEPSTTKIVRRALRTGDIVEVCQQAASISVNPFAKLNLLAEHFIRVMNLQGDVADLGAYKGGVSLILRKLAPDKELHVFDTWEGTPYDDELCHHRKGEWKADLVDCRSVVGVATNTHYWQGIFPDSAVELLDRQFCFVYVDPDTYRAVCDAIEFFWPRMVYGGKMFFDDYGWEPCAGVKKAVDEAFSSDQRFIVNNSCIVVKR